MKQMEKFEDPVLVTRPFLPDVESFKAGIDEIWKSGWLSNDGPMVRRFAAGLSEWLGIDGERIALFSNGTQALEIALQSLGIGGGGEVITTPFTFVATAHAIVRAGAKPVFADVDPETLCLSPEAAERAITPRTKAILPVHVYGRVCDLEGFARLGKEYGLKIIYDAAHAFGVECGGMSVAEYGDAAMFSFHPTKLFHSCEGGMLVFRDPEMQKASCRMRNFAILSETECVDVGTNAKMNELQALMGLECLKSLDFILAERRRIFERYRADFEGCGSVETSDPRGWAGADVKPNHAYCPVMLRDFEARERVYEGLKKYNVFARRYFWPLLTAFAPYAGGAECPVAEAAAARVLTLPTYGGLGDEAVDRIAEMVKELAR